ncbi:putative 2,5-dichloro-2,5-cyclohexadiene-1,4-diol dehydrogenase [Colletotrichum tanaceti]|uniref:Putative 2,5-dichloro-2,5-cyclohexadiene-1,4-diol dehydrogenase n=1 Tax=Colletotrichum tanaceti TaxID=1306861 RepID=A0A4U6X3K1_9PEZI|nr:putative 2,5-dichloro-2,5-cyclohexadiene-1,4-diol dehydrogenase [Colletotrichum tanaceti]TKW49948.1 putative 2,5-dichloro-2,5-cyclohexadiene-1,4-diol dehydrogenase [Colletotrichum tanaceti]
MGVNAKGVLNAMRAEIPALGDGGKGKSIVNVASLAGLYGLEHEGAYVASKHAVVGLTKTAAKEFIKTGLRINAVCPGAINTPMMNQALGTVETGAAASTPFLARIGEPIEIARAIAFLLGDEASFVAGQAWQVDGGSFP